MEIEACPFCGECARHNRIETREVETSVMDIIGYRAEGRVVCCQCGACGPWAVTGTVDNQDTPIDAWNMRSGP